ncbi:MAG: hypothetical protein D6686_08130 [Alphaproteobacteria bacterium]|nr:MAG: hypothetical protein D6686_08130 [Alphaproteobacteria bacterium]
MTETGLAADGLVVALTLAALAVLLAPRLRRAAAWRAIITPLASIIGSGFLVLGPILVHAFGWAAPLAMATLCGLAWGIGAAIRFNIACLADRAGPDGGLERRLESLGGWALSAAYVVSVTYYLNLFGAFAARAAAPLGAVPGRVITAALLVGILLAGLGGGLRLLERLEGVSVAVKLAVIAGLLAGLAWFDAGLAVAGGAVINPLALSPPAAAALVLGLLITVQGFETSRYLGDEYEAALRIRTMRLAQIIATGIYVGFALLIAFAFPTRDIPLSETGVIDLAGQVAAVLPALLFLAALAAQFSAAVADTLGAGGLVAEESGHRIDPRWGYAAVCAVGLGLTFTLDIYAIIAWASRAFAFYYAIQCALAGLRAQRRGAGRRAGVFALFGAVALAALLFGAEVQA